jgi:ankyrin repeat protein
LEVVLQLLECGIDVNMLYRPKYGNPKTGYMPLHVATMNKQEEVAELLIRYGADVNATDEIGNTPILYAAKNKDLKITKLLVTNKANVQVNPGLLIAVKNASREIVEILLQHGAEVNTSDEDGRTALHFTVSIRYCDNVKVQMTKFLLSRGGNVNAETKTGQTPLHTAAKLGCVKVVEALLEYNADVNCTSEYDRTTLRIAAEPKDKYGTTPLHFAATNGHVQCIGVLVKFGASIDCEDECGRTALHPHLDMCVLIPFLT